MNDPLRDLRDIALARALNPEEEERARDLLARHPELAAEWRRDLALGRAMRELPDVAVPSNFTSRVLAEVKRDIPRPAVRSSWWRWVWLHPARAAAWTAVVLICGGVAGGWAYREHQQQAQYVQQVATLRALADLPPQTLSDFDAIQRLSEVMPPVDYELLSALR